MKRLAMTILLALWAGWLTPALAAFGEKKQSAPSGGASAAGATQETKSDPVAGQKLFKTHCAICHFADAAILKIGPGMKGLFKPGK